MTTTAASLALASAAAYAVLPTAQLPLVYAALVATAAAWINILRKHNHKPPEPPKPLNPLGF